MPLFTLEESGLASELTCCQGSKPPTDLQALGAAFSQILYGLVQFGRFSTNCDPARIQCKNIHKVISFSIIRYHTDYIVVSLITIASAYIVHT